MLNCKEVSKAIASDDLETFGLKQRLAVRFHLLMCQHCRRYARQIRAIGAAARELFLGQNEDAELLQNLERNILEKARQADADQ